MVCRLRANATLRSFPSIGVHVVRLEAVDELEGRDRSAVASFQLQSRYVYVVPACACCRISDGRSLRERCLQQVSLAQLSRRECSQH